MKHLTYKISPSNLGWLRVTKDYVCMYMCVCIYIYKYIYTLLEDI
jgi:hypothetical protein